MIIEEGGNDTIALGADIKPENIDLSLKGKDLLIKINGGENGSIHIRGYAVDDKIRLKICCLQTVMYGSLPKNSEHNKKNPSVSLIVFLV